MLNNKKKIMGMVLLSVFSIAQAEVLVILPESGPMERAGNSIKQGFMAAYQASQSNLPLRFVNETTITPEQLLKMHINDKTQLIIGPLSRQNVEAMVTAAPKIKVLALNDASVQHPLVWQFSLSKQEDALALKQLMHRDGIKSLYILRETGQQREYALLIEHLSSMLDLPIDIQEQAPKSLDEKQGVLILGNSAWLNRFSDLKTPYFYTVPNAVEIGKPLPLHIKFCDTPALYEKVWLDILQITEQQKLSAPFQRLLAFGGDAWQITETYLKNGNKETVQFQGRTGQLTLTQQDIQRLPHCYIHQADGIRWIQ